MGRSVTSRSDCAPYFVQAFRMLVRVIGIPINQELLRKELVCEKAALPSTVSLDSITSVSRSQVFG